jgi:glycosyltransferase involved in cell wall biosynthesis
MDRSPPSRVFFAYRDAPERRAALRAGLGSPERYRLFGLDEVSRRGVDVAHNLEREGAPRAWARVAGRLVNRPIYRLGGYGGDFASILGSLRRANSADVILSTVDTVGIPLLLLKRARLVRPPLVYVSVGLPERLEQLGNERMRRLYADALRGARAVVAYAESEVEWILDWIGPKPPPVLFVPFGVDVDAFRPEPDVTVDVDVVSVGADPRRDFALLVSIARRHPELTFAIVAGRDNARGLTDLPANVSLEVDVALARVRELIAKARVVALPVRDNSYSGATTVLLQAMAMAKPVVVSRTAAIATGYGLDDGVNCRLVDPGDADAFERALLQEATGAGAARFLGTRARETVARSLSWERYTDALWQVLCGVSPRP